MEGLATLLTRAASNCELLVAGGCVVLSRELPLWQDRNENFGRGSDQATVAQMTAQHTPRSSGDRGVQVSSFRSDAAS